METLSVAARSVWAKTGHSELSIESSPDQWLPLWRHLDDTALISEKLWDNWLSANAKHQLQEDLGASEEKAKQFFMLMAGVHDVGKASPSFSVQIHDKMPIRRRMPQLITRMQNQGLDFGNETHLLEQRAKFRHETVGQIAYEEWLLAGLDLPVSQRRRKINSIRTTSSIIGGHHGSPPTGEMLAYVKQRPQFSGVTHDRWGAVQQEFINRALYRWAPQWTREELQQVLLSQASQVIATGGVIIADWLASDSRNFPLAPWQDATLNDPIYEDYARASSAWDKISFPTAWLPDLLETIDPNSLFQERFGGAEKIFVPRPSQKATVQAAQQMEGAGLIILEAPMGEGKTEAALAAAEVLAAKVQASGVYIALPTMATSDAMLRRVKTWLRTLPDKREASDFDMWLGTSRSSMNQDFSSLFKYQSIAVEDQNTQNHIYAHRWINSKKRGMLASMAVGTIDHILLASLQAKHVCLRHLGLANKVVIIDEVHAADVYMSTYLRRSIEWLGFYRVPVILLSATLPSAKREELLKSYAKGRNERDKQSSSTMIVPTSNNAYPLLSATDGNGITVTQIPRSGRAHNIQVQLLEDDENVVHQTLREALSEGGTAVVIRNTVRRAQDTAAYLESAFGTEAQVSLAHSAYMASDRNRLDNELVREFGPAKENYYARYKTRRIVVSTQVIEQSLDVDFDVMIVDLAPVDLLLQRVGRLHRHGRDNRPQPLSTPKCYITGGYLEGDNPELERGAQAIYGKHLLYRTVNSLRGRGCSYSQSAVIHLPEDIPMMVEDVYAMSSVTDIPAAWVDVMADAHKEFVVTERERERKARKFLLGAPSSVAPVTGWVSQGVTAVDEESVDGMRAVRDGDESLEVYVVLRKNGLLYVPLWKEGAPALVPISSPPSDQDARLIMQTITRLPYSLSNPGSIDRNKWDLEDKNSDIMQQWQEHWMLAGELVLVLDDQYEAQIGDFWIHYDHISGLRVEKA